MVHYISPYSVDKNIGKAINDAVKALNCSADDWIVHCDQDMMWLLPDSKAQVEHILKETTYEVLGCMTNRVGSTEQCRSEIFSENDRIRDHIEIAIECRKNAGDIVVRANGVMAAFMLCFRVSAWTAVAGFNEGVLNFDTLFCWEVNKICTGGIGLMKGVYVFHSYRLWSQNARKDIKHLT